MRAFQPHGVCVGAHDCILTHSYCPAPLSCHMQTPMLDPPACSTHCPTTSFTRTTWAARTAAATRWQLPLALPSMHGVYAPLSCLQGCALAFGRFGRLIHGLIPSNKMAGSFMYFIQQDGRFIHGLLRSFQVALCACREHSWECLPVFWMACVLLFADGVSP